MPVFRWQWCTLDDLSARQLYALLAAREAVFVVEQNCAYQDLDGLDIEAEHLIGWADSQVAACLRLLAPGVRFPEPSLGRILTTQPFRGTGCGRELVARGLAHLSGRYPGRAVRISAQAHLEGFYGSFGFVPASQIYLEDGIPHLEMLCTQAPEISF